MRKIVCRLRLNEVSRQWRRRPKLPPNASCSCISCSPTGCPPRGEVGRRPASGRSSRQGMSPPHGCGGRSHGSAARSRCWYGCGSNARWENRSRSAFPLYNFLGHSLLSPFRMVCGNFILPEPACYVFFYAIFNLRTLLYIIFPHAAGAVSGDRNRTEIAKAPPENRRGFWGAAKRKESDQYFCSGAYFSCSFSSRSRSDSMRLWRARICSWVCICGTLYMWFSSTASNRYGPTNAGFMPLTVMLLSNRRRQSAVCCLLAS